MTASRTFRAFAATLTLILSTSLGTSAHAGFTSYIIRNGNPNNTGPAPTIQANNDYVAGATEFIIVAGGQKAGWGSGDIDGSPIGAINNLGITRWDDTTRFTAGSGPAVAPFFNIWVTDGGGNYAVLANEPSNPSFQPKFVDNGNGSKSYSLSFADIANEPVQVYETANGGYGSTTTWVHNLVGNHPLTFADVADLEIGAPSPAYIAGGNGVGTGAPRELGTNMAYGFNWVFGDTLTNYVSGADGYIVSNPVATPEPASLALAGLALVGGVAARRRFRR
jgi:hypothetical protein